MFGFCKRSLLLPLLDSLPGLQNPELSATFWMVCRHLQRQESQQRAHKAPAGKPTVDGRAPAAAAPSVVPNDLEPS